MSTNLPTVTFDPSVPAHLRLPAFLAVNNAATAGIGGGTAPHRLSIRAARFRLVDPDGNETLAPDNGATTLDVAVLDTNEHVSKMYYSRPYDPNAPEPVQPDCFSDNGVGPSDRAVNPQAASCALCPHNAWGSKVAPNGSQVKACSDSKKVAVLPIHNIAGPAHVLSVPPASLKPWKAIVDMLTQRGVPIPAMVFRLGFDPQASSPKLTFMPIRWLSEQEGAAVAALAGSREVDQILGRDDKPKAAPAPVTVGTAAQGQFVPMTMPPLAPAPVFQGQQAHVVAPQPAPTVAAATEEPPKRRRGRPPASAPEPQNPPAAPAAAAPIVVTPAPVQHPMPVGMQPLPPHPDMPGHTQQALAMPPAQAPTPQMPPIPEGLRRDAAPPSAQQSVVTTPMPAPQNLEAMMDKIMGPRPA